MEKINETKAIISSIVNRIEGNFADKQKYAELSSYLRQESMPLQITVLVDFIGKIISEDDILNAIYNPHDDIDAVNDNIYLLLILHKFELVRKYINKVIENNCAIEIDKTKGDLVYYFEGDYSSAKKCFKYAKDLGIEKSAVKNVGDFYFNLGCIDYDNGNIKRGILYFKMSLIYGNIMAGLAVSKIYSELAKKEAGEVKSVVSSLIKPIYANEEEEKTAELAEESSGLTYEEKSVIYLIKTLQQIERDKKYKPDDCDKELNALVYNNLATVMPKVNYKKVLEYYKKAYYSGCQNAAIEIGKLYEKGLGVDKDIESAIKWYDRIRLTPNNEVASLVQKRLSKVREE